MDFRDTPGGSVFETTGAYQFKEKRILRALEALRVLGIDTTIRVKRALGAAVEFPVRMEVTRESHTRRETITLHIARELFVGYLVHLLCHRADRLALEDIQQIAAIAVCLMDPRDDKKDLSSIPVEMSPGSVDLRRESSATVWLDYAIPDAGELVRYAHEHPDVLDEFRKRMLSDDASYPERDDDDDDQDRERRPEPLSVLRLMVERHRTSRR